MTRRLGFLMAVYLIGCGKASEAGRAVGCGWTPDPELHGAHLDNESNQPWAQQPDLKPRLRKVIEQGANYWGVRYTVLYGWKIHLVDNHVSCYGGLTGFNPFANACVDWFTMTIEVRTASIAGIESSALPHEMGHVVLAGGDPAHLNSRFNDTEALSNLYDELTLPCRLDDGVSRRPWPEWDPIEIATTDPRFETLAPCIPRWSYAGYYAP